MSLDDLDVLVTGSSGFIGSHLCRLLSSDGGDRVRFTGLDLVAADRSAEWGEIRADIRSSKELSRAFEPKTPRVVLHLAAVAEAVVPFHELENMVATNVLGTLNLVQALAPELFLFASTSAVYGNARIEGTSPSFENMKPVGAYGVSKMQAELALSEWVRSTDRSAVAFRFGNVIGEGCRGLIPYLVGRAIQDPRGTTPTRLRGEGRIVRDYVPVDFTVAVLRAAVDMPWPKGGMEVVNVASGRPRTNADVAGVVQRVLRQEGYTLDLRFDAPLEPGEAEFVVLDPAATARRFGIPIPNDAAVDHAIEKATHHFLSTSV